MTTTSPLTLWADSDQTVRIDVTTEDGGVTPLNMNGYALGFVVRRNDDVVVCAKTTGSGISIGNGAGTKDRATVTILAADIAATPGRAYTGALWRTDSGSKAPYWEGPVTIRKAPAP